MTIEPYSYADQIVFSNKLCRTRPGPSNRVNKWATERKRTDKSVYERKSSTLISSAADGHRCIAIMAIIIVIIMIFIHNLYSFIRGSHPASVQQRSSSYRLNKCTFCTCASSIGISISSFRQFKFIDFVSTHQRLRRRTTTMTTAAAAADGWTNAQSPQTR